MALLELRDVTLKVNGHPILNGLSFEVWESHVHALVGPNGAGKTTAAAVIMGLPGYEMIEGDVLFEGQSLKGVPVDERARRGITLAWQEPARFEGLKVRDFIAAGAVDGGEERLGDALQQVGLDAEAYLDRAVDKTLSGGERKRIELASILAMEPRLVMMDEPDSGIDVEALDRIFQAMEALKERGATVLAITHSKTVLERAEHAFLMCCGRMVQKGAVEKIREYFSSRCIPCEHHAGKASVYADA